MDPVKADPNIVHARRLDLIATITSATREEAPLDDRLVEYCRLTAEALGAEACVVRSLHGEFLDLRAQYGVPEQNLNPRLRSDIGIFQTMLESRHPLTVADAATDPLTSPFLDRPGAYRFVSYAGVPMIAANRPLGIIGVYTHSRPHPFTAEDMLHLQIVANHLAAMMAYEELMDDQDRRVQERTDALANANARMEELIYAVAHDLRAPLRLIVSTSQLLLRGEDSTSKDEQAEMLTRQAAGALRLSRLLDDLLALARVDELPINPVALNIDDLVQKATSELEIDLSAVTVEGPIECVGDARLVGVALRHILANCKQYADPARPLQIMVGQSSDGAIFVRDNGVGFDPSYADKIFRPFERLVTEQVSGSTGVGLATVRRIAELHRGEVTATSELGVGTEIRFKTGRS